MKRWIASSFRPVAHRVFIDKGLEPDTQSEDYLYLNIWTPEVNPEAKKPVFMWIHGGRYANGGGSNIEVDGEAFCREGVIFVSVQFRLGVFGYANILKGMFAKC